MNRAIAGVYDPHLRRAHVREVLVEALAGEGSLGIADEPPLRLAWTRAGGGGAERPADVLCVIDGSIHNLETLARQSAARPGATPEAILVAAYRRWGEGVLERLRGDFVVVLWERAARRGLAARDQLGERSLFLHEGDGSLAFASEIRNLLHLLPRRPDADRVAVAHWLALSGPPGDRTLYDGVRRLQPGHYVRLGEGRWAVRRYWSPRYAPVSQRRRNDVVEELREGLADAVRRRLGEGETTGVLLSGGLDSSGVAALARQEDRPLRAYSAVFPEHRSIDESALIDRLTEQLRIPGVRITVRGGSALAGALAYLAAWRVPPTSPNLFFWAPLLERAAADGACVLLDGEGGDELFGLTPYLLADRLARARPLAAVALARRFPGAGDRPPWRPVLTLVRRYGLEGVFPAVAHEAVWRVRGAARYTPPWFSAGSARAYLETDERWAWKRRHAPRWWAFLVHALTNGSGPVLARDQIRRRAASAGVEARHPLFDLDLVELVLRSPPELAFDPTLTRPLLREALNGLLPDELRLRATKSNFDALFHESLAGPDLAVARRLLTGRDVAVASYVDLDVVRAELLGSAPPRPGRRRQDWAAYLWRLVTAECWLRTLDDPAFPEHLLASSVLPEPRFDLQEAPAS